MSQTTERFSNIYRLQDHKFEIIGCGSIGSFTAMNLARAGAQDFMLWDDDHVATVNIGVQHFGLSHVGNSKVKMLRKQMVDVNPQCDVKMLRQKYNNTSVTNFLHRRRSSWENPANGVRKSDFNYNKKLFIVIGIDNMYGRKEIAEIISGRTSYFHYDTYVLDGRMGSETFQMYKWKLIPDDQIAKIKAVLVEGSRRSGRYESMDDKQAEEIKTLIISCGQQFMSDYLENWYSDDVGNPEPCNARSTNYCASMAASFLNNQIRKICDRKSTTDTNVLFNFPQMIVQSETDYSKLK